MRDVVVLGAGLAGSSLAAVLSALGWKVVLVERRAIPHHKVCGEFLSPESQASLWAMGLYDAVAALQPSPMHRARLVSRRGVSLALDLPGTAWGVSRYALDQALATAAQQHGAEVQTGVAATSITPTAGGVAVTLRTPHGETEMHARTVIGAFGRHPLPNLRPQSQSGTEPRSAYVGVKCHYVGLTMPPQVDLFLFEGGYVGLSPIEDGRCNLCLLATRAAFARAGGTVRGMLDAVAQWNPALGRQLAGGQPLPDTEVAVAPVDTERVPTPWDGMARVGDAAVMIPPLCGDGMAMALRAAELAAPLANAFLRGTMTLAEWEHAHRAAWHNEFDRRLRTGRRLQAALATPLLAEVLLGLGHVAPLPAARLVQATRGEARPLDRVQRIVPFQV